MTTIERKMESGETLELSEAFEAIRILDLAAEEICRVDMRINPDLAKRCLEHLEGRRREIQRQVKQRIG